MPELVKRVVGSFWGISEAFGILLCPLFSKQEILKVRNTVPGLKKLVKDFLF